MKNLTLVFLILVFSKVSVAEKLDLETHSSLIQKLESVVSLDSKDSMVSQVELSHRLADLYAERARLLSLEEEGKGDQIHKAQIQSDRQKSLKLLSQILEALKPSEKGQALMQMAHLHSLLDQPEMAFKIYTRIQTNPNLFESRTVALAEIQLGDIAFLKGDLKRSQFHFERALKNKDNPRKGYSHFRLAWIHFNLGQTQLAEKILTQLLKTPSLMQNAKGTPDLSFQEETSHDLATFMASNGISKQSITTLSSVSPENTRKKNLVYLATELDRTGKKSSALLVWNVVGTHELSFEDQLERQIQVTRIQYDLGNKTQILKEIDNSIALLKNSACNQNEDCVVGKQSFRRIITDWGKAEERLPSQELTLAYLKYTQNFDDEEMNYWAGQASLKIKAYPRAFGFYKTAANLIVKNGTKNSGKRFEGSLLGAIEAAELSKNIELRVQAYSLYLELNPSGDKRNEVRYQLAHSFYEKNDYKQAVVEFRKLALDTTMSMDLREKSADLCLDTDVLLKNEDQIETHSLEFANNLKAKAPEYLAIWRKSILNRSAAVINTQKSDDADKEQLKKLSSLSLKNWPASERKEIIKNKMTLSYRLKDLSSLTVVSKEMLAENKITVEEQNSAINQLAWASEVQMNFPQTLAWMKKMKPAKRDLEAHIFKIALLKELTNQNPTREYQDFLAMSRKTSQKQYAAHQIVIHSKNPAKEFRRLEGLLAGNSNLYRSAGLFVFERNRDQNFSRKLLSKASVRNSLEGQLISHSLKNEELAFTLKRFTKAKLKAGSDSQIKRSLTQRIQLLKELESQANQAISRKDSYLQLVVLSHIAVENNRLADEILALPLPRGLKAADKKAYQDQVQNLTLPYREQAKAVTEKTIQLWSQSISQNTFKDLYELSEKKERSGSILATQEIATLRISARNVGYTSDPFKEFSSQRRKVVAEAQNLQQTIQRNPFNFSYLEKMKGLQNSLGSGPMVAYLDGRLSELKEGGTN